MRGECRIFFLIFFFFFLPVISSSSLLSPKIEPKIDTHILAHAHTHLALCQFPSPLRRSDARHHSRSATDPRPAPPPGGSAHLAGAHARRESEGDAAYVSLEQNPK
jgi:hypothetical protein